jgi:hypothetical protein
MRAVPTFSDDTRTLVRKNTTREMARMSFRNQLLVTTQRITTAKERGPVRWGGLVLQLRTEWSEHNAEAKASKSKFGDENKGFHKRGRKRVKADLERNRERVWVRVKGLRRLW